MENYNLCFIIAHKYCRNYKIYIKYYIDNINKFYNNSLVIIVDNNSKYIDDIKILLNDYKNVLLLTNNTESKFEPGAYNVGINYIINNNLLENYDYYIFTHDNFILKNKYDFNILKNNNTNACALHTHFGSFYVNENIINILTKINLQHRINELETCWACSFVLNKIKIIDYLNITKDIIATNKQGSHDYERYVSGILYYLNDHILTSICGPANSIMQWNETGFHGFNAIEDNITPDTNRFFVKTSQGKTETTID